MKALFLLFSVLMLNHAMAQKISANKIPATVISAFKQKYPNAEKASWGMTNTAQYYANFKIGKDKYTASFDKDGNWVETMVYVSAELLPREVIQSVSKQLPGYDIVEAQKVETSATGIIYKLNVEKKDKAFDLQVSPNGDILKKQAVVDSE